MKALSLLPFSEALSISMVELVYFLFHCFAANVWFELGRCNPVLTCVNPSGQDYFHMTIKLLGRGSLVSLSGLSTISYTHVSENLKKSVPNLEQAE